MIGVLLQWWIGISVMYWWLILLVAASTILCFLFLPIFKRFRWITVNGVSISFVFISLGAVLINKNDIRKQQRWIGKHYRESDQLLVKLDGPLLEKANSYQAVGNITALFRNQERLPIKGRLIIYFKKGDSAQNPPALKSRTSILFTKKIEEINDQRNPGGFNFKRYSLFQRITHQVYLEPKDFLVVSRPNDQWLDAFINASRKKVIEVFSKYIQGPKERGLAEALLIGYKTDLDPDLVKSYTNTGVVHVIAISGMHLGLIYWLLSSATSHLKANKRLNWTKPLIIILGLWAFSLIAGAQPSVTRSALMFSCIVLGKSINRKSSILNTLGFSAFLLICYNPFWLWDPGFQLSYAAVLSIILFQKAIYDWLYVENKFLDLIWKLIAVTLSAQILTTPFSIYHFHQFPNYFLFTNIIAIPLSGVIIMSEIGLLAVSSIQFLGILVGKMLTSLIAGLNSFIQKIETLPYAVSDGLFINPLQVVLLLIMVAGISNWLLEKSNWGLKLGLITLLAFCLIRSLSFIFATEQQKLIVYNIPHHTAVDFIDGRNFRRLIHPAMDPKLTQTAFYIKPAETIYRLKSSIRKIKLSVNNFYFIFNRKKILLYKKLLTFKQNFPKPIVDVLIISNPGTDLLAIAESLSIRTFVFDSSIPRWKIKQWKPALDSIHIPYYDINEKGAFVMNMR